VFQGFEKENDMHFAQAGIQSCYLHDNSSANNFQNQTIANNLMQRFYGIKTAM
jgi:hypothetical protein